MEQDDRRRTLLHRDAMDVVLTWGPERAEPEDERLQRRQPTATDAERDAALATAREVLRRAEGLAPTLKGMGPVDDTVAAVRRDHPWLDDELWSRAANQGMYFDWRDNGR
jgi:hypothetical protein